MNSKLLSLAAGMAIIMTGCLGPRAMAPRDVTEFAPVDFQAPTIETVTLTNGMKVLMIEDHELPIVRASIRVRTGSIYEPADKTGLAGLTGSVMRTGGTRDMTGDELDEELEFMAASIETGIGKEAGTASISILKKDVERGFELFANVLRYPEFREEKLELARMRRLEGIRRRYDEPTSIAAIEFPKLVYGADSPWARVSSVETISAITRDDLIEFHKKYFAPNNMTMAVSGDFEEDDMVALLEKVFKGWEQRDIVLPKIPPINEKYEPQVYWVQRDDAPQTVILLGHLGMRRHVPEQIPIETLNYIYGLGGFTSRLMREVRSNRGLAYSVYGYVSPGTDRGLFQVFCQTKAESTVEATQIIRDLTTQITNEPVSEQDLVSTKEQLVNKFVFKFESSSSLVRERLLRDYLGYAHDYLDTYTDKIREVTTQDMLDAAKKYVHPDGIIYLFVGDKSKFDGDISNFGTVREITLDRDSGTSNIGP